MQIKVLSWNIWKGKDLSGVIEFLQNSNADIISLQEVLEKDSENPDLIGKNGRMNMAKLIAGELKYDCIYCKVFTTDRHKEIYDIGNAILSKHKIEKSACFELSGLKDYKKSSETEPRGMTWADITIGNRTLKTLNTHLAYSHELKPFNLRQNQINKLLEQIDTKNTILFGDFNTTPHNGELDEILKVLQNTDPDPVKPTWSVYPTNYKGFIINGLEYRIDNIFVSRDIKVKKFKIENSHSSDHLPISAILEI